MSESKVGAKLGQPAASPDPIAIHGIHDRSHKDAVDHERRILPPLGHRAGRDGGCGIHEDHLEEEESKYGDIIAGAAQKEAGSAKQAKAFAEKAHGNFFAQTRIAAHRRDCPKSPKHDGKSSDVETDH